MAAENGSGLTQMIMMVNPSVINGLAMYHCQEFYR